MTWWKISGRVLRILPPLLPPPLRPQPQFLARRAFGGGWTIRHLSTSRRGKPSLITTSRGRPVCPVTPPVPVLLVRWIGGLKRLRISQCRPCNLSSKYIRTKFCLLQRQTRLTWMSMRVLQRTLPAMRKVCSPARLLFKRAARRLRMKPGLRFLPTGRNASP